MKSVTKIIIPAAGIGSRFLPFTKSVPKEMLPLSNKPAIQYIVQEAIDAKIPNVSIVLSPEKTVILDYFSCNHHLDQLLEEAGKTKYMESLHKILDTATFQYFIQNQPKGLANALLHAHAAIDENELFAVALPDDIIFGESPEIQHLKQVAEQENATVIAVQEVPEEHISSYGVIDFDKQLSDNVYSISHLVEKPPSRSSFKLSNWTLYFFTKTIQLYKKPLHQKHMERFYYLKRLIL